MCPHDVVEFYITCNPPLEPVAVRRILQHLSDELFPMHIVEILYEPDIPWFKIITLRDHQEVVKKRVQAVLLDTVQQSCSLPNGMLRASDSEAPHDVSVVEPNVLPWAALCSVMDPYVTDLDDLQYPRAIRDLKFKSVWRGLEDVKCWTFENLFQNLSAWQDAGAPCSVESLRDLLGCDVSHNWRSTCLYLGTDEPNHCPADGAARLDTIFQIAIQNSKSTDHLVFVDDKRPLKFAFKWLSHVGLDRLTYVDYGGRDLAREYQLLRTAVVIRAKTRGDQDGWHLLEPRTASKAALRSNMIKPCHVFADYRYPPKEPRSMTQYLDKFQSPNSTPVDVLSNCGRVVKDPQTAQKPEKTTDGVISQFELSDDLICLDVECQLEKPANLGDVADTNLLDDEPPQQLSGFGLLEEHYHNRAKVRDDKFPSSSNSKDSRTTSTYSTALSEHGSLSPSKRAQTRRRGPENAKSIVKYRTGATRIGDIKQISAEQVKELSRLLQHTPGYISVKLKFGRFYMTDISHSQVDPGSGPCSGPHQDLKDLLSSLKEIPMREEFRFSTVLSSFGPDADFLAQLWLPGKEAWLLAQTDVFYDVQCAINGTQFMVEINAVSFDACCRGPSSEVASLYIHCVERVWDMKVCMERSPNLNTSEKHISVSKAIVASLHVIDARDKGLCLEMTASEKLGAEIEQRLVPQEMSNNRRKWTRQTHHDNASLGLWYEAWLSSKQAEDIFKANIELRLGDDAVWTCDELEEKGVFASICEPAFGMIKQMDDVGRYNNNGKGGNSAKGLAIHDALGEENERHGKVVFW